jgi:hypothetical protein
MRLDIPINLLRRPQLLNFYAEDGGSAEESERSLAVSSQVA